MHRPLVLGQTRCEICKIQGSGAVSAYVGNHRGREAIFAAVSLALSDSPVTFHFDIRSVGRSLNRGRLVVPE